MVIAEDKKLFSRQDLLRLVLPMLADLALTLLVGMIDSVMVAGVGEDAVSGVSLVDTVIQIIILVFSAFATGGAVVAGQYLGARREDLACQTTSQLVWFSGLVSLALMALMYAIRGFILNVLFGSITPEVYYHANRYLLVVVLSVPALSLYQSCAAIFRTMGKAQFAMKMSMVMNAINVVGNALLIYGLHMGTAGAAASTVISRYAAAIVSVMMLTDGGQVLHVEKTLHYRPDRGLIGKILQIGVPNGVENGLFQIGKLMLLSLISTFGTSAIAANSVSLVMASLSCIPGNAMGMAETTVIARCVGAKEEEQTRYYNRVLMLISYLCMGIACTVIVLLLPWILRLYHLTPETAALATEMTKIHSFTGIVLWPAAFVLPSALRAAGDVKYAMIVSIVSMWIFRIGAAYFLANTLQLGAVGAWWAYACDWTFRGLMFTARWVSGRWKNKGIL